MYEIWMLVNNGNPAKDWGRYCTRYKTASAAKRAAVRLMNSGLYRYMIVKHESDMCGFTFISA